MNIAERRKRVTEILSASSELITGRKLASTLSVNPSGGLKRKDSQLLTSVTDEIHKKPNERVLEVMKNCAQVFY